MKVLDVIRFTLRQLMKAPAYSVVVATGVVLGLFMSQALRVLLFRVGPLDPLTWCAALTTVTVVVVTATYLSARRAADMDPVILLRR